MKNIKTIIIVFLSTLIAGYIVYQTVQYNQAKEVREQAEKLNNAN
ncbi:hypothetical protein [Marivirga sp.]|nr:hypothetical protein [Marivirga sp.]HET8858913.1 hypothetical protein [Marivirga sp.]